MELIGSTYTEIKIYFLIFFFFFFGVQNIEQVVTNKQTKNSESVTPSIIQIKNLKLFLSMCKILLSFQCVA